MTKYNNIDLNDIRNYGEIVCEKNGEKYTMRDLIQEKYDEIIEELSFGEKPNIMAIIQRVINEVKECQRIPLEKGEKDLFIYSELKPEKDIREYLKKSIPLYSNYLSLITKRFIDKCVELYPENEPGEIKQLIQNYINNKRGEEE